MAAKEELKVFLLQRERYWSTVRHNMGIVVTASSRKKALEKVAKEFNGKVESNGTQGKFVSISKDSKAESKQFQPYIYLVEMKLLA